VDTRNVVTGARVGQDMVIQTGLQPGETVVTEGQLRLAPGSKVVVRQGGGTPGGGGRRANAGQAPAAASETAPAAVASDTKGAPPGANGEHKGRGGHGHKGKDGRTGPPQD
jgi:multidrug efflux system membrane fusion protein